MTDLFHAAAASTASDHLSPLLQDLRLTRAAYCRTDMTAPWGVAVPRQDGVCLHFVVEGDCCLRLPSRPPVWLAQGDLAFLPRGTGHALADDPDSVVRPLQEFEQDATGPTTRNMRSGGHGPRTLIVCCAVEFEEPAVHPLTELMPELVVVRGTDPIDPALPTLLALMAAEVAARRIGSATVMARLADAVVTHLVRAWAEADEADASGWLAGVRDPRIGRAVAAIHRQPGHIWSVDSLARLAALSRSAFTERFTAAVGLSPGRYLAQWRMHLAGTWLRNGQLNIADVAQRLGYESEASFSRAFKRLIGVPPGAVRAQSSHGAYQL